MPMYTIELASDVEVETLADRLLGEKFTFGVLATNYQYVLDESGKKTSEIKCVHIAFKTTAPKGVIKHATDRLGMHLGTESLNNVLIIG